MKGLTKTLLPLFGLVAAPLAAQAAAPEDGLDYNYLEAGYVFGSELDYKHGADFDADGFRFKGSAALTSDVFVWGSSHNLDLKGVNDDGIDIQSAGVGYRFPLISGPSALDLWGGLSYEHLDVGASGNGYGATLGLRWLPVPEFELSGFAGYRDFGKLNHTDVDGGNYGVGAAYNVTRNVALLADWERWSVNVEQSDDATLDTFSLGVRWNIR